MADAICGGYYSTEPNQAGGGGYCYWTASIELNGDFVVAEVYGDTADEVRDRCHAFLSGLASPPGREEAPAEGAGDDLIEAGAKLLWNRFSSSAVEQWADETHKAEYRLAATDLLALSNRTSSQRAKA